ncbi:protein phosphatase 2C domain-containing protein [Streptomyces noursei]|uniref:protein phosphatase 2C domain-containing protein n=1 Tax=Streptomyces noursei TaxID=1971 RepID=UPI0037FEC0F4
MEQQGAGRGREDDWWWRELYGEGSGAGGEDGEGSGTGPPAGTSADGPDASDTLDERIESVMRTMGQGRGQGRGPGGGATGAPLPGTARDPVGRPAPEHPAPGSPGPAAPGPGELTLRSFEPRPWEPSSWEPRPWEPPGRSAPRAAGPPDGAAAPAPAVRAPDTPAFPEAEPDALADPVPDTVLDGARFGPVAVRAVSQRGADVHRRGDVRGEAYLTARFGAGRNALFLVAVATGRSTTGAVAHRAARAACAWAGGAVDRNATRLAQDLRAGRRDALRAGLQRLTDRGFGALRGRAAELGMPAGAHPAALRCLLLPADPQCRTRVFFAVGGGGLFRLRHGGWEDLEPADAGPPTAPFRFRAVPGRPGDVLLLCGTGLAEPLSGDPDFAARLAAAWSAPAPPDLAGFLAAVQPRGAGDAKDRTAVGVWES